MGTALLCLPLLLAAPTETVVCSEDNLVIERSCRVEFAPHPIPDPDGNGVVWIRGDDLTVDLGGSLLRGAAADSPPDSYRGTGIHVQGKNVRLVGARVSGFRIGIQARAADGLTIETCDLSDNFRQRLGSTEAGEDASDWLWPHENEGGEWAREYGAGLLVRDSKNVTVRNCRARRVQNGLLFERVQDSFVYDNDFSFLSGWGLALWRSGGNTVSRNAFDFCIRGYSHGVYNRGQDSAGILLFEQCSNNVFVQNSATHGGDGFFAFAGREALGERAPMEGGFSYVRRGNNDNLLIANDLSYAAAHGVEVTFSFGNQVLENRIVGNAICGVWGGYSQDTTIAGNEFAQNGSAGYGLERGGVNIEHGRDNRILANRFTGNACGIHLWWDPDTALLKTPWVQANGAACSGNSIAGNLFRGDETGVQLRTCDDTRAWGNVLREVHRESDPEGLLLDRQLPEPVVYGIPSYEIYGTSRPVGARPELRGRDKIQMTEWGPYAYDRPALVRTGRGTGGHHRWKVLGLADLDRLEVETKGEVRAYRVDGQIEVRMEKQGRIVPYELTIPGSQPPLTGRGTLGSAAWSVVFFPWSTDPREDPERWRAQASEGVQVVLDELDLAFGNEGPGRLEALGKSFRASDRFGSLATSQAELPAGKWQLRSLSDDGIRVWVDDSLMIDNWTHHAPTVDKATFELPERRTVGLRVEHFELDGNATLKLELERIP